MCPPDGLRPSTIRSLFDCPAAWFNDNLACRVALLQQPPDRKSVELRQECLLQVFPTLSDGSLVPVARGEVTPVNRHPGHVTGWHHDMQQNDFRCETPCERCSLAGEWMLSYGAPTHPAHAANRARNRRHRLECQPPLSPRPARRASQQLIVFIDY
jgi:hypothetical protein